MRLVVLALDVGERRIGVAVGDSEVKIAVPMTTLDNDDNFVLSLNKIIIQKNVERIVVGLPRNSIGEETKQSQIVREFAKSLQSQVSPEIVFQDESLTSVGAEQTLKQIQDSKKPISKAEVDARAAAIILTDYLEANFG